MPQANAPTRAFTAPTAWRATRCWRRLSIRTAAEDITRLLHHYGRRPLGLEPAHRPVDGKPLPHGCRSRIREILQDAYFVLPKPEKYAESYRETEETIKQLFSEQYQISSDFVEAKSIAVVASIILDEVREGQA